MLLKSSVFAEYERRKDEREFSEEKQRLIDFLLESKEFFRVVMHHADEEAKLMTYTRFDDFDARDVITMFFDELECGDDFMYYLKHELVSPGYARLLEAERFDLDKKDEEE